MSPNPPAGIVFDIDGVIVRGHELIPGAKDTIHRVAKSSTPFLFVTNNGMELEAERAARLTKQLDLPIREDQVVLAHSGLMEVPETLKEQLVLVTGFCKTDARTIMKSYGFKNVHTIAEYAACFPTLVPNKEYSAPEDTAWAEQPVAAVMIIETPVDWHEDLQVIVDVMLSDGRVGQLAPEGKQVVQLYNCNFDFTFPSSYSAPRLGPGAFLMLVETMYTQLTGGSRLEVIKHGKPHPPAYRCALRKLQQQAGGAGIERVYAIGDNPKSDVRGARGAGDHWRAVLVRTGVFSGGRNDPEDPAHFVVPDVSAAVELVYNLENMRLPELAEDE